MKLNIKLTLVLIGVTFAFRLNAQNTKPVDASKIYLDSLEIAVGNEKDAGKKEALSISYLNALHAAKKYGPEMIDYIYVDIATTYAAQNNLNKALEYANKFQTPNWKAEGNSRVALLLLKNGFTDAAGILLKRAVEETEPFTRADTNDYRKVAIASGYKYYCTDYADVLYRQKKYEEALTYIKIAHTAFPDTRFCKYDIRTNTGKIK